MGSLDICKRCLTELGHLVAAEDGAPPRELEVGGDHDGLPLVGVGEDLEQQAAAVGVQRQEPEVVDDEQPRPADLGRFMVEPALVARLPQAHHERGGRE